jgi:hypothetical protein
MDNKHTLRAGVSSLYERCSKCNLNCEDMYNIFRKTHKYAQFEATVKFINDNVPCLTKNEWLIKELLE